MVSGAAILWIAALAQRFYYVFKKYCPILYSNLLYKMGHHFLDSQYSQQHREQQPMKCYPAFSVLGPVPGASVGAAGEPPALHPARPAGLRH